MIARLTKRAGIALKLTHEREGKTLCRRLAGHAPANRVKRLKLEVRRSVDVEVAPVRVIPRGKASP